MALREDFERYGNWLFRWRSYLPLVMVGILLVAMRGYQRPGGSETLDHLWEAFCLCVSFLGLYVRILTVGHAPTGTSGRNTREQMAHALNTTGMYSIVRNPLYLGNFFMALGIALFSRLWWFVLIYALAFWLYYERIIFAEEEYLRRKFGDEYLAWANATPAFIPRFGRYRRADTPFSWRRVLRREHHGFFSVIVVMFLLETIGERFAEGRFEFDAGWIVLLSIGFVVWTTLTTLKKYTGILLLTLCIATAAPIDGARNRLTARVPLRNLCGSVGRRMRNGALPRYEKGSGVPVQGMWSGARGHQRVRFVRLRG